MGGPLSRKAVMPGRQAGVTTRQARAALLLLAAIVGVSFVLVRSGSPNDPRPGPRPAVAPEAGARPGPEGETDRVPEPVPIPAPREEPVDAPKRDRPGERYVLGPTAFDDVASGLAAADEALEAGRIFQPAGDNALEYYLGVLAQEPDNAAALEGLAAVRALLARRFEEAAGAHALDEAAAILELQRAARADPEELARRAERLERLERAEDFLVAARRDMAAGRVESPAAGDALARLARARELDPTNPGLEETRSALEELIVRRALDIARTGRFERAFELVDEARLTLPGSRRLAAARDEIEAALDERIERGAAEVRRRMGAAEFRTAEDLIEALRRLGASPERIERLRDELRHARIYGRFGPGERFRDELTGARRGPVMIVAPHGDFLMGSTPAEPGHAPSEAPRHRVSFARGFALSETEVTVGAFAAFVAATGYETDAEEDGFSYVYSEANGRIFRRPDVDWRDDYRGREAAPELPVVHVSWNDAAAYARWLASVSGAPYRLPSEAEYEYVLRAGTRSPYWWGEGSPERVVENLTGAGDRSRRGGRVWNRSFEDYEDGFWGPAPAGSFVANPFGYFDLAGNVEEWVADCWHDSYVRAPSDGSPWVNRGCPRRVLRGGFWGGAPQTARSAYRTSYPDLQRGSSIGFRVARDLYRRKS